ncbi:hypothetical protein HDR66_02965 [bacterium]|nr:hypothetical protein [bacterium]
MTDIKRKSLTYYVARYDIHGPRLREFIEKYNMDPHVGQLPGALRERIAAADIPRVTIAFNKCLDGFVAEKRRKLIDGRDDSVYSLDAMTELFGTRCIIEAPYCGKVQPWHGFASVVCRVSFPEIGAQYALKIFRDFDFRHAHGPWYEIPTAVCAYAAEPRDNNRMYIGAFGQNAYMLSDWAGEEIGDDLYIRQNKNEIYTTAQGEQFSGNYRRGRRIDYGRTTRTAYGAAPYQARKIYRQLRSAARTIDAESVTRIQRKYNGNAFLRRDFDTAIELIKQYAGITYEIWMSRVLGDVTR